MAASGSLAGTECFVDDDSVGCCGCYKGSAVGESCPARVGVEGDVRQAVAESAEEEGYMSNKPAKLECLGKLK